MRVSRLLLALTILLFIFGIYDVFAYTLYLGSKLEKLAEGSGFERAWAKFYLPDKEGTLLICYEIDVKPNILALDKYAELYFVIFDSRGKVIWVKSSSKGVKSAVKRATGSLPLEANELSGIPPYTLVGWVKKVGWGELEGFKIAVKYSRINPTAYSSVALMVEVFTACLLPFAIFIVMSDILSKFGLKPHNNISVARSIAIALTIILAYLLFRFALHNILGLNIDFQTYLEILTHPINEIIQF